MTRLRASTIHLFISIILFLALLGAIFSIWYPSPYFETDGNWKILGILAGVHVILGPLLTLILFKPGKPGLKFDMTCIVLMQASALLYGGIIIYQQRPSFVVFGIDRFTTVAAAEVEFAQLKYPELQRVVSIGPLLAQAQPPEDPILRQKLLFGVLLHGEKDLEFRAELYEPYRPHLAHLRAHGIDLAKIAALDEAAKAAIETFAKQHSGRLEDYLYLPLKGKNQDIVLVLSAQDGMPTGWIPISPWLEDYRKAP